MIRATFKPQRAAVWLALSLVGGWAAGARADGVTLDRYHASETVDDGFSLSRPDDQGHLRAGAVLHLDYANDPLVLEVESGDTGSETASVVRDQLAAQLTLSLGLWKRVVVFAGLGASLIMKGDRFEDPVTGNDVKWASAGLGDTRLGARVRLLGERDDVLGVGLQASVILPTAQAADAGQRLAGESAVALVPKLLLELRLAGVRVTGNVGAWIRKDVDLGSVDVGDELLFGLGVTVPIVPKRFELLGEFTGASVLSDLGNRESSPIELLAGGKFWLSKGCAVGLGAGPGVARGVGAPDVRVVGTLGCATVEEEPAPVDSDGDGIPDSEDRCPTIAEDLDGFQDDDGCPDPDNDGDGVLDAADRCPNQAEDRDGFEDQDGCPDPDNDGDGVLDAADRCPDQAEDRDGFEDQDGCPDPDNDGDGILDADDHCPTAPGTVEQEGCPKTVRVEEGRLRILQRIEFATGKDTILASGEQILEEVRATLAANPQIRRIRVQGHTDSRGSETYNMTLSKQRAAMVMRWLREHGIAASQVEAAGCGEIRPIADNETTAGQQENRRVEFQILDPTPAEPASSEGCEPSL